MAAPPGSDAAQPPAFCARLRWVAAAALVLLVFGLRWRLLEVPLERDEGEYAYGGVLLLSGVAPYEGIYNMKLPGIYAAYAAVLALFGESVRGVHLGLALADALSAVLLFAFARRLLGDLAGLVAGALFALLALGSAVQGTSANAEHFVLPPALAGLTLLGRVLGGPAPAPDRGTRFLEARLLGTLFAAGVLLGLGFVVKQHGAFLAGAGLAWLALAAARPPAGPRRALPPLAAFSAGALVPYGLTCLLLAAAGVFGSFWRWTVEYAGSYTRQNTADVALARLRQTAGALVGEPPLSDAAPLVWAAAGVGLVALFAAPSLRRHWRCTVPFVLLSALSIVPGLYFRPHYFVLTLPAAAFLAAAGLAALTRHRTALLAPAALVVAGSAVVSAREVLFQLSPEEITRRLYPGNPFVESQTVAGYVEQRSRPHERIAVLGSEPQIYFYARRRSATPYVYAYALMERHPYARAMHEELIAQLEEEPPAWLIFVRLPVSWLRRRDSEQLLFDWLPGFLASYELDAVLLMEPGGSRLVQAADPPTGAPLPPGMDLYRRRD